MKVVLDTVLEDDKLVSHIAEVENGTVRCLPNRVARCFRNGHVAVKLTLDPKDTPIKMQSTIIPFISSLPQDIRSIQIKANNTNHNSHVTNNTHLDFKLAKQFLAKSKEEVSMGTIVFRSLDHVRIGDAREHSI